LLFISLNLSSSYLLVFSDDRVTCYMRADGVAGEDVDG